MMGMHVVMRMVVVMTRATHGISIGLLFRVLCTQRACHLHLLHDVLLHALEQRATVGALIVTQCFHCLLTLMVAHVVLPRPTRAIVGNEAKQHCCPLLCCLQSHDDITPIAMAEIPPTLAIQVQHAPKPIVHTNVGAFLAKAKSEPGPLLWWGGPLLGWHHLVLNEPLASCPKYLMDSNITMHTHIHTHTQMTTTNQQTQ